MASLPLLGTCSQIKADEHPKGTAAEAVTVADLVDKDMR